jgi:hypothetical protein
LTKGGIIAGHDYMDGTDWIDGEETVFGVKSAVDEFFQGKKICKTLERKFRSWWVQKPIFEVVA